MSKPKQNSNIIPGDLADRTLKGPSPVAATILVGLRAVDIYLQYSILSRGWATSLVSRLGGQSVSPFALPGTGSVLGLQPYHAIVLSMAIGSTLKHVIWMLFINEQVMPIGGAFLVPTINTVFNSINTVLSVWALTSLAPPPSATLEDSFKSLLSNPTVAIGITVYLIGLLTETVSEFQRKAFKSKSENKGKPYAGGLFSLATNINYGGYTLWRAGYAMFCAGWTWGLGFGAFVGWDFCTRAIPILDIYCTRKVCCLCCAQMKLSLPGRY